MRARAPSNQTHRSFRVKLQRHISQDSPGRKGRQGMSWNARPWDPALPGRTWPAPSRIPGTKASLVVLMFLSFSLASCGGNPQATLRESGTESPRPESTGIGAPLATPQPTASTPRVGAIIWATTVDPETHAPVDTVSRLPPDAPRIIAAAKVSGLPPRSRLVANWEYNNTSLDPLAARLVTSEPTTDQWVIFQIERSPDVTWPDGI